MLTSSANSLTVTTPTGSAVNADLHTIPGQTLLGNSGASAGPQAIPVPVGLSTMLDGLTGAPQGSILIRGNAAWIGLAPGTSGFFLASNGAGNNPGWVAAGAGLTPIASNTILSNVTGASAIPIGNTMGALLDATLGNTPGMILRRVVGGWQALAAGTLGQVLTVTDAATPIVNWANPQAASSVIATIDLSAIGIFSYDNFGAISSLLNSNGPGNATAMTNMFAAVAAVNGGRCWFRAAPYYITPPSGGFTVPPQARLQGASTFAGTPNSTGGAAFGSAQIVAIGGSGNIVFLCTGNYTQGGQFFENLGFSTNTLSGAPLAGGAAISAQNGAGVRAKWCTFLNIPTSMIAACPSAGLDECAIVYSGANGGGPGGTTSLPANVVAWLKVSAPDCYANGPAIWSQPDIASASGPTGTVGISLGDGTGHFTSRGLRLSLLDYGITYGTVTTAGGVSGSEIGQLRAECNSTCLYIQPGASTGQIHGEKYTSCKLSMAPNSVSTLPVVYIDTNGGSNQNVDNISFTDVDIYQGGGDGLVIANGRSVYITGGAISGNGTGGAGIAVTGPAGNVTVNGTSLRPQYVGAARAQAQLYAVRFAAGAAFAGNFKLTGCDLAGYSTTPTAQQINIGAGAFAANGFLYVNLCTGYNDQNSINLNGGTAPTVLTSTSALAAPFFGPSVVSWTNTTAIPMGLRRQGMSTNTSISSTCVTLTLGPYDQIVFAGGAPAVFRWSPVWG